MSVTKSDAHNLLVQSYVKKLSIDAIAIVCCVILVFCMGRFQLADLLGIKRLIEFSLILPVLMYVVVRIAHFSASVFFNPLFLLVILMLGVNLYFHADINWIADYLFSLLAIISILIVSPKFIILGAKWVVGLACFFSILASIQFVILLIFPSLATIVQVAVVDDKIVVMQDLFNTKVPFNPLMLFGFVTTEQLNIMGFVITRMRSFTTEPSLLVAFFVLPAIIGFYLNQRFWSICSCIIISFSILSFSGSVQICMAFSILFFFLSFFLSVKQIFLYFPVLIVGIIVYILINKGVELFLSVDASFATNDDLSFLAHGNSLVVRSEGLVFAVQEALSSPFGSSYLRELPLSIVLSSMISAGWIGGVLVINFFYKIAKNIDFLSKLHIDSWPFKIGTALFFGVLCTIFTFNDYAMLNYSGLTLIILFYRQTVDLKALKLNAA